VYFYKIGGGWEEEGVEGLGIDRLARWMELFGFGQFTNVELPAEDPGFIPSSVWKRRRYGENWATGDTYNAAFGQGYVLSTPLQMLNAVNVIINGGYLYQPTLIDKFLDGEGNVLHDTQPILLRDRLPISDETIRLIREGMREAVLTGTLEGNIGIFAGEETTPIVDVPGVNVAGKTGTAEYCDKQAASKNRCEPGNWPTHSWTALYAPYENPEVSVIVFVYNGGEGSKVAAPVANAILRAYFQLKEADTIEGGAP
jgi:penicillin-binding protein 2